MSWRKDENISQFILGKNSNIAQDRLSKSKFDPLQPIKDAWVREEV
jgi:hypothetical protein